jgi:hypothetical protein
MLREVEVNLTPVKDRTDDGINVDELLASG